MARWLFLLVLVGSVALGARSADAQVFKPRTGSKTAPARKPSAPTPVAAAPSKKPTRSTSPTPRRTAPATPAKKPPRGKAHRGDVEIDDDDDVKITDD